MKKLLLSVICIISAVFLYSCVTAGDMNAPDVTEKQTEKQSTSENTQENTETNVEDVTQPVGNDKQIVKFAAAGDVLIHGAIYREAEAIAAEKADYSGNYYFKDMYKGISELVGQSDIAFANHEGPIAKTAIAGYPNFNSPSESGDALVELGFNVINIANNHMFDVEHKTTGYEDTIEYWDTKEVLQIGGYKNGEDYNKTRIVEANGIKIAFLAYTYDPYLTNKTSMNSVSKNKGYILPVINDSVIINQIANAKQKADFIVVSVHWGVENTFEPTADQKRVAKLIADNGANVIIGHHSHTLQPVEWINGANGNKTLCVYSLGNLISGMLSSKNMVGGFITFDIVKEDGEAKIENPVFRPTVCHYNIKDFSKKDVDGNPVRTDFQVYLMEDYTEESAKMHGTQNYGRFTLDTLKGYVKNEVPVEFLPDYLK